MMQSLIALAMSTSAASTALRRSAAVAVGIGPACLSLNFVLEIVGLDTVGSDLVFFEDSLVLELSFLDDDFAVAETPLLDDR